MMKNYKLLSTLLCALLLAALLAGCAEPKKEESALTAVSSAAQSSVPSETASSADSSEGTSSEEASSEEVLEWEFQNDWPVYVGIGYMGNGEVDWDLPPCGPNFDTTDKRFREAGIFLLYHVRIQPLAAAPSPTTKDVFIPSPVTEENADACHAYIEGLEIPFDLLADAEPIYDGSASNSYHATLSYEDMKKLYREAQLDGYEIRFFHCDCDVLAAMENTVDYPCP